MIKAHKLFGDFFCFTYNEDEEGLTVSISIDYFKELKEYLNKIKL